MFLEAAREDRLEALYVLAIHCGLRQGELLGLRWEDVDLEEETLQVRRTLTLTKGGPSLVTPKTPRSRRTVRLTVGAVEALKRRSERQLRDMVKANTLHQDQGLVFASVFDSPLNRHNLGYRSFKPLLKRAVLPDIRFHDLRHTCATKRKPLLSRRAGYLLLLVGSPIHDMAHLLVAKLHLGMVRVYVFPGPLEQLLVVVRL
jgi:integrase